MAFNILSGKRKEVRALPFSDTGGLIGLRTGFATGVIESLVRYSGVPRGTPVPSVLVGLLGSHMLYELVERLSNSFSRIQFLAVDEFEVALPAQLFCCCA